MDASDARTPLPQGLGVGQESLPDFPAAVLPPPGNLPSDPSPVGSCLLNYWRVWDSVGADNSVVRMLRHGYKIPFLTRPTLSPYPVEYPSYQRNSEKFLVLKKSIEEMLQKQAIEVVRDNTPGFYSRMFIVPKKSGKWRPIIDLSPLNKMVDIRHFRMETPATVLAAVTKGQWMTSIDLSDATFTCPFTTPAASSFGLSSSELCTSSGLFASASAQLP